MTWFEKEEWISLSPLYFSWSCDLTQLLPVVQWNQWKNEMIGETVNLIALQKLLGNGWSAEADRESLTGYLPKCDPRGQQHPTAKTWVKLLIFVFICVCFEVQISVFYLIPQTELCFQTPPLVIIAVRLKAPFGTFVLGCWHSLSDKEQAANLFSRIFFQLLG